MAELILCALSRLVCATRAFFFGLFCFSSDCVNKYRLLMFYISREGIWALPPQDLLVSSFVACLNTYFKCWGYYLCSTPWLMTTFNSPVISYLNALRRGSSLSFFYLKLLLCAGWAMMNESSACLLSMWKNYRFLFILTDNNIYRAFHYFLPEPAHPHTLILIKICVRWALYLWLNN
jgi:hypothetical protein